MNFAEAKTQSTPEAICLNRLGWAMDCLNAPKACHRLTVEIRDINNDASIKQADCCLGRACRYLGLRQSKRGDFFVWDDSETTHLSPRVQRLLNIQSYGKLSNVGLKRCRTFFGLNSFGDHDNLADINDHIIGSDDTLSHMSALLCWLWACEYLEGETIFL